MFDHRYYWEAHEVWEAYWHRAEDDRTCALLQGMIQLSAAFLKRHMGHQAAAARLMEQGLDRFVLNSSVFHGMDMAASIEAIRVAFASGTWPLLVEKD